jgi:NADPH:quinone reductase-like Zn-dependent oxidoreductase
VRAARIEAAGGPVELVDLPDPPAPGPGRLLVHMLRAPVNPADVLTSVGRYSIPLSYPFTMGAEGVGEVLDVGAHVVDIRPGDHVLPLTRGNWATLRLLDRSDVIAAPADIPAEQAAMLRINPATAWRLLRLARLQPGDAIVQNGAASAVARWVRAIAAGLGCSVINVVRAGGQRPDAPDVIVDGPDLADRVMELAGGGRIPLALDCVAGEASGRLAACLSERGVLAVFGQLSGLPCTIPPSLLTGRGLTVKGFSLRPAEVQDSPAEIAGIFAELFALFRSAALDIPIAATYPLTEVAAALRHASEPHAPGRIMLALD